MGEKIWKLEIACPEDAHEILTGYLSMHARYGWEEKEGGPGEVICEVYSRDEAGLAALRSLLQSSLPDLRFAQSELESRDWATAWRQFFTPVECGKRFVILPPWLAHMEHGKRQAIIIDPKNAFGTGHHATTVLCLKALDGLLEEKRIGKHDWFLDLGCGTGILGIAACKFGLDGTGLDIDPEAIANARENRELNEASRLELLKGGIEKVGNERFDLIMANILAGPLMEIAPRIRKALEDRGVLVLSGILDRQADSVIAAYKQCGFGDPEILADGEWRALIWK